MKQHLGWAFPDVDKFMVGQLKSDGTYQGSHLDAAMTFVTDTRLAIDGGAHVGTWTKRLSALFEEVIAVEPSPDTFEALVDNIQRFTLANVSAKQVALGCQRGRVSMTLDAKNEARANTGARFVQPGEDVFVVTIDEWNLTALGFLKLDIEGSEVLALQGAVQTIKRCQPIILFENKKLWTRYGFAATAPQTLLTQLGYRQLSVVGCDLIYGPR